MLTLKAWLDEERGRYTALAAHLGVTVGRVSQMADDGVPVKFMQQVRSFTREAVSLEALVAARTPPASEQVAADSEHPAGAASSQRERDGERRAARTRKDAGRRGQADKPSQQRKGR